MKASFWAVFGATAALAAPAQLPLLPAHLSTPSRLPPLEVLQEALPRDLAAQLLAHVSGLPEPRRLRWSDGHEEWITEGQKALLVWSEGGRRFEDITEAETEPARVPAPAATARRGGLPTGVRFGRKQLAGLEGRIDPGRMRERLTGFTSFRTRYYRSQTGRESQAWLLGLVRSLADSHPSANLSVSEFPHPWGQNSIIARWEPRGASSPSGTTTVVIGAHQDSTNLLPFLPAPGADDDGSGTTTLLEALTVLLDAGWRPEDAAVEFHWYSAEEGGMLGSGEVTRGYKAEGKSDHVKSMLQFDMTAWVKRGTKERVGIVTDYVDPDMSQFVRVLVDEYLDIPWVDTKCGYACSDHSSWTNIGVPSAFGIEATFEDSNTGNIHSTRDRLDISDEFSFEHMGQFVRLALGYIVEMTGGVGNTKDDAGLPMGGAGRSAT